MPKCLTSAFMITINSSTTEDNLLVISTVQREDEGDYSCLVENVAGSQMATFTLKISGYLVF